MKLTVFILLVSVTGVFANKSYSQSKMLNLNLREATVKEVLNTIEKQSEFCFLYSENLINVERKVDVTIKNKKIEQALNLIFEGTDVDYSIRNRFVVLTTPEVRAGEFGVLQQKKNISGTATDEAGEPLPGVTVLIKGTTNGTVTNFDGEYTIANVSEGATLQFSFVGMKSQEIVVGIQNTIDITLVADAIGIDEVVAIGYGYQKKQDVTSAISMIDLESTSNKAITDAGQLLAARSAGVRVVEGSYPFYQPGLRLRFDLCQFLLLRKQTKLKLQLLRQEFV